MAAGMDGINRKLPLASPVQVDAGLLSDAERRERNIQVLPKSLEESLNALKSNTLLLGALAPALSQAYLAVKWSEWNAMKDLSLDEEVKLLQTRY